MTEVYVVFAAEKDRKDAFLLDAYVIANSHELATKIAKTDESDGQIYSGWHVQKMKVYTSEEEI